MVDNIKLTSKILQLQDMVEYQEGAVVSRTLVDKDAGTITLFAFDVDQALSEHTAPYDAMVHLLDGEMDISISGEHFQIEQGESIIMPADKPHALRAMKPSKMLLIMIQG